MKILISLVLIAQLGQCVRVTSGIFRGDYGYIQAVFADGSAILANPPRSYTDLLPAKTEVQVLNSQICEQM